MDDKVKLAAVLLGGYLLGRTKRMKTALMVAGALATRGVRGESQGSGLLGGTLGGVTDSVLKSPELKRLRGEVTGKLVGAGKAAALAAATRRIDSLSSGLQDRTERLRGKQQPADESAEEPEEPAEGEEAPEEETAESEYEGEEAPEDEAEEYEEEAPEDEAEEYEEEEAPEEEAEEPEAEAEEPAEEEPEPPAKSKGTGNTGARSARSSARKPAATRQRRTSGAREQG